MKNHTILWCIVLTALWGCENDGLEVKDIRDIEVPEGFVLSAGTSTVFKNSSYAYDTDADWVGNIPANEKRFTHGDRLYDNPMNSGNGLGPVYAGYSCGSCHRNAGRTKPSLWTQTGTDPDGTPYELVYPEYTITDWYKPTYRDTDEPIRPEDLFCTVRIPLRHVGMGQMMALDPAEIEELARRSNYPEYGISGRANYITERGRLQLGLSGNKAQHADLTVELGFSSDMGVTNSRYPEEICEGQSQMQQGSMMGLLYDKLEISTEDMEDVDFYLHGLGVPARRLGSTSTQVSYKQRQITEREMVAIGEQKFFEAKCHLCHVTTLHTKPRGAKLLNGTELPWLGNQTIHPYSDYLLHDMGSEIMGVGLDDHYVSGLARGNEWRTTPLWGIGLQEKVNAHTYFLHDGRARNLQEAILWHGGEGEASKNLYKNMHKDDRSALIKFLESL